MSECYSVRLAWNTGAMIELSTIESAPPARAMSAHAAMSVTCMRLSEASTCEYQAWPSLGVRPLAWGVRALRGGVRVGGALDPDEARVGLHGALDLVQVAHVHVAHLAEGQRSGSGSGRRSGLGLG